MGRDGAAADDAGRRLVAVGQGGWGRGAGASEQTRHWSPQDATAGKRVTGAEAEGEKVGRAAIRAVREGNAAGPLRLAALSAGAASVRLTGDDRGGCCLLTHAQVLQCSEREKSGRGGDAPPCPSRVCAPRTCSCVLRVRTCSCARSYRLCWICRSADPARTAAHAGKLGFRADALASPALACTCEHRIWARFSPSSHVLCAADTRDSYGAFPGRDEDDRCLFCRHEACCFAQQMPKPAAVHRFKT